MSLLNYKDLSIVEYLDGSYFRKVLVREFPTRVVKEPATIQITDGGYASTLKEFLSAASMLESPVVGRVIIESFEGGTMKTRHSNLLIVDNSTRTVTRFEPSNEESLSEISAIITEETGWTVSNIDLHPQPRRDSHCLSYVLMYAYFFLHERGVDFSDGILRFELVVKATYPLPSPYEPADVEFGSDKTTGTVGGALIGGGLGALAFGVPGLLIGAGGGALLGNAVSKDD